MSVITNHNNAIGASDDNTGSLADPIAANFPDVTSNALGQIGPDPTLLAQYTALAAAGVAPSTEVSATAAPSTNSGPAFIINATYDSTIVALNTIGNPAYNPTVYNELTGAIQTAIQFFESEFTNSMTVNLTFGYGELDNGLFTIPSGSSVAESVGNYYSNYTYADILTGMENTDTTTVGVTAANLLENSYPTDPITAAHTWAIAYSEAKALGLAGTTPNSTEVDGYVGISKTYAFTWNQPNIAANTLDAVAALEHEITETMGRVTYNGTNANGAFGTGYGGGTSTPWVSLLSMFRYTAHDGGGSDAIGTATGVFDEPWVAGYNSGTPSYFSYDGATVTLPYDNSSDVAQGDDIADWDIVGDSFGFAAYSTQGSISTSDLQEMNVLGFNTANDTPACFAAGTRIATMRGEVPVEALRPRDMVRTAFGEAVPVVWIGQRRVNCARHPEPEQVWPVRVMTGAFGPGQPHRDLFLSPDHAVFTGGVLIPIRLLINDTTIARTPVAEVAWFHVELDHHSVLLAEGLPAESFLDTGTKRMFTNGGSVVTLHPNFTAGMWEAMSCAPLVLTGPALASARQRTTAGQSRMAVGSGAA